MAYGRNNNERTYFENSGRTVEVDNLNMSFSRSNDHKRILNVHSVNFICHVHSGNRIWSSQVPVLDGAICLADLSHRRGNKPHTLTVLSQLPVAKMPPVGASTQRTALIGASCAPTCWLAPVARSNIFAALSTPPEKSFDPSLLQQTSRTGASCA